MASFFGKIRQITPIFTDQQVLFPKMFPGKAQMAMKDVPWDFSTVLCWVAPLHDCHGSKLSATQQAWSVHHVFPPFSHHFPTKTGVAPPVFHHPTTQLAWRRACVAAWWRCRGRTLAYAGRVGCYFSCEYPLVNIQKTMENHHSYS